MTHTANVRSHYDRQAASYSEGRAKGWLGRLVRKEMKKTMDYLGILEGQSVLDAGCGSGDYSVLVRDSGGHPFGIDVSPAMIQRYRELGFPGEVADLQQFELHRSFDRVLCAGSLEFVPDVSRAFGELRRHLKPGGYLVWIFPRRGILGTLYYLFHLRNGLRIHLFSKKDVIRLGANHGFEIRRLEKLDVLTGLVCFCAA